ncbi:MAG TPA: DNA-3-methyladenine glycosylase 2 family protein [Patescibacteria group bacterium]|nr:DNA-3-methyladenine glycosylase 2 family protein [Patescibacteria group bacterium]
MSYKKAHTLALQYFKKVDPVLYVATGEIVLQPLRSKKDHFGHLVSSIVSQQLSSKAADTILSRLFALYGGMCPSPRQLLATRKDKLRKVGLSRAKVEYIKNVAVFCKDLDWTKFTKLDDAEIVRQLTGVKGVGVWTVQMFMIFSLGHPDIFAPGDLGLRNAVSKLYGKKAHLTPKELETLAEKWKPYRSFASRLLWKYLDV